MNKTTTSISIFLLCFCSCTFGQVLSSKVIDSVSKNPIPYVTILLSDDSGVITNEEGQFSIQIQEAIKNTDSIFISCMGYETMALPLQQSIDSILYLQPKAIELNHVILTNKEYTADELLVLVKNNINQNYNRNTSKKRLFYRESNYQNFTKMDYTFKKSTIKEFNKEFIDSILQSFPKSAPYYTEILCDFYGDHSEENQKINIIKASQLYDKNAELSFKGMEEKFNTIIKRNVKPDSYFKIKSGIFGTKVDMDDMLNEEDSETTKDEEALKKELEEKKKHEEERKKNFSGHKRSSLARVFQSHFFTENPYLNFLQKPNRYDFKVIDFTFLGNEPVYIVDFTPSGSEKNKGRLYINADDYAILRIDYENVKSLKRFNLMGISLNIYQKKGKKFFAKGSDGLYNLHYYEMETGSRFGISRPLKIIEKNKHVKGRRKQNELFVKLDMAITSTNKSQIVVFDVKNIAASEFDALPKNNKILPTYMSQYDPEFWKGYNIIEPNTAIREFTVEE
ncbi:MAG: hypothetical protein COA50_01510 [Flavobacteriaceae bacterium]|nr:MAG: hypothetical protein COA50_01510 [Flavobacteriaceae bacterium]